MKSSNQFLLEKIVDYKTNGLDTLGQFHGRHFNDIAEVMRQFGEETVLDVVERINKGETIMIRGMELSGNKFKGKKRKI